eukprot:scaffold6210_cov84-Isochrysis_galbana.AAC.1
MYSARVSREANLSACGHGFASEKGRETPTPICLVESRMGCGGWGRDLGCRGVGRKGVGKGKLRTFRHVAIGVVFRRRVGTPTPTRLVERIGWVER